MKKNSIHPASENKNILFSASFFCVLLVEYHVRWIFVFLLSHRSKSICFEINLLFVSFFDFCFRKINNFASTVWTLTRVVWYSKYVYALNSFGKWEYFWISSNFFLFLFNLICVSVKVSLGLFLEIMEIKKTRGRKEKYLTQIFMFTSGCICAHEWLLLVHWWQWISLDLTKIGRVLICLLHAYHYHHHS